MTRGRNSTMQHSLVTGWRVSVFLKQLLLLLYGELLVILLNFGVRTYAGNIHTQNRLRRKLVNERLLRYADELMNS